MLVHYFRISGKRFGLTDDRTGGKLPLTYGQWTFEMSKNTDHTTRLLFEVDADTVVSAIEKNGYYLTDRIVMIPV